MIPEKAKLTSVADGLGAEEACIRKAQGFSLRTAQLFCMISCNCGYMTIGICQNPQNLTAQ